MYNVSYPEWTHLSYYTCYSYKEDLLHWWFLDGSHHTYCIQCCKLILKPTQTFGSIGFEVSHTDNNCWQTKKYFLPLHELQLRKTNLKYKLIVRQFVRQIRSFAKYLIHDVCYCFTASLSLSNSIGVFNSVRNNFWSQSDIRTDWFQNRPDWTKADQTRNLFLPLHWL